MIKNSLTEIEYLCLRMMLNPGRTTTFYAKHARMYRNPFQCQKNSSKNLICWDQMITKSILTNRTDYFIDAQIRDLGPKEKSRWFLTSKGLSKAINAARVIGLEPEKVVPTAPPPLTFTRQLLMKMIEEGGMTRADAKAYYDQISNASPHHSSLGLTRIIRTYCTTHDCRPSQATGRDSIWCKVDAKITCSMLSENTYSTDSTLVH